MLAGPVACNRYSGPKPPSPENINKKIIRRVKSWRMNNKHRLNLRRGKASFWEVKHVITKTGRSRAMDRIQRHFCTLEERLPAEMRAPFTGSNVVHGEREEKGGKM